MFFSKHFLILFLLTIILLTAKTITNKIIQIINHLQINKISILIKEINNFLHNSNNNKIINLSMQIIRCLKNLLRKT